MTEKELKKLNRYQLLEMIILQTEQIADLERQLEKTRQALESQQIRVSQAGSIAEAALQLSGIFEAAQTAADTYLANVLEHTKNADQIEADARKAANQVETDARKAADQVEADARKEAEVILSRARTEATSILENARQQADTEIRSAQIMLEETTRRCAEKENAVNTYISNIREAFHLQFQNLDQIGKP